MLEATMQGPCSGSHRQTAIRAQLAPSIDDVDRQPARIFTPARASRRDTDDCYVLSSMGLSCFPTSGPGGLESGSVALATRRGDGVSAPDAFPGRVCRAQLRAGDGDRDRAVARLREHHVDGRLNLDEFTERMHRAYASKTLGDLELLFRDLPATTGEQSPLRANKAMQGPRRPPQRSTVATEFRQHLMAYLGGCAGLAWAAQQFGFGGTGGALAPSWLLLPIAAGGAGVAVHAWAAIRSDRRPRPEPS